MWIFLISGDVICNGRDSDLWIDANDGFRTFKKYKLLSDESRCDLLEWLKTRFVEKTLFINDKKYVLSHSFYNPYCEDKMYKELSYIDVWNITWSSIWRDDYYSHAANMKYICTMPEDKTNNNQIFYNIEILDEAISGNKKVSFKYLEYGTDKKQHLKCREDGEARIYVVSPYQMVAKEGKYYLICNYDKYDDVSNYRIDRITDIEVLDEKAKPFNKLKWSDGQRLNLSEYMKKHVYMYSSDDTRVIFRIVRPMISDVIDMFGKDITFFDETADTVCVKVNVNETSMLQFAKNYAPDVEILEPLELREKIKEEIKKSLLVYK